MDRDNVRHWVWAAYVQDEMLIYGCLVHAVEPWATVPTDEARVSIDCDGTTVWIVQAILDTSEAGKLVQILQKQATLDLSSIGGATGIAVKGIRHRLIDGFGRTARPTETYAGKMCPALSDKGWAQILDYIRSVIGTDHRAASDRLNAFDIFDRPDISDIDPRIDFSVARDDVSRDKYPEQFTLQRLRAAGELLHAHVELRLGGDLVHSQLLTLAPGDEPKVTACSFDTYRMSVFDRVGLLVQFEEYPLLLRARLNLSSMGPEAIVEDRLSQSAQGLGEDVRTQASIVRTRSTSRSEVGVTDLDFDVHQTQMRALARRIRPSSGADRWFERGIAHEVGVIAHLNELLDGGRTKSALIIDPFFGAEALQRIVPRLESLDVLLTVVTSLGSINPDTNELDRSAVDHLRNALESLRRSGFPNATRHLRLINLANGARQAFHDRYLSLIPHEGDREIYLLSNSFNRMAGNWPFCMSKLDEATTADVARYIDGLATGRDVSGSTNPIIDLNWPDDEK